MIVRRRPAAAGYRPVDSSGFRSPPRSPPLRWSKSLSLRAYPAMGGCLDSGWLPKKSGLTLAKCRATPPSIARSPGRNRDFKDLAAGGESLRCDLAYRVHQSTALHRSDSSRPIVRTRLSRAQRKGYRSPRVSVTPSGVSRSGVSRVRTGLTSDGCRGRRREVQRDAHNVGDATKRTSSCRFRSRRMAQSAGEMHPPQLFLAVPSVRSGSHVGGDATSASDARRSAGQSRPALRWPSRQSTRSRLASGGKVLSRTAA